MVDTVPMNMRILRPTRSRPKAGSVFVLRMPDDHYSFGRVIRDDARSNSRTSPKLPLVYIYSARSLDYKSIPFDSMGPADLLIPPVLTNWLPWTRGYFMTIAHRQLTESDAPERHSFFERASATYLDEYANRVEDPTLPAHPYGLASFRSIDDDLSEALGFALAPD